MRIQQWHLTLLQNLNERKVAEEAQTISIFNLVHRKMFNFVIYANAVKAILCCCTIICCISIVLLIAMSTCVGNKAV